MSQTKKHCEPLVAVWLRPSTTEPCICCKQVAEKPRGEHLKNDVCMYVSKLCSISKKIIFNTALCRCRYLDGAGDEHPANMCATVSAALPRNRHMIWSGPVLVFFL